MENWFVIIAICLAYLFDLLLGDPLCLPHPIVYFGRAISWGEKRLNKGSYRVMKGAMLVLLFLLLVTAVFYGLQIIFKAVSVYAYAIFVLIFVFYGLANRTLINEGRKVFVTLETDGLEVGRKQLSRIVGRDTSELNEEQIKTAVLETMAENLSDGVVAPLFWFTLLGVPGMMAYKLINTFDSMIGYKNERYLYFGRFAARLDDVLNYIPARITGVLMSFVSFSFRAFRFMFQYGSKHSSPNAGYPESALAGILNVRFGGPNVYHGHKVDKPFIGAQSRTLVYNDFKVTARVNHAVCLVCVSLIIFKELIFN